MSARFCLVGRKRARLCPICLERHVFKEQTEAGETFLTCTRLDKPGRIPARYNSDYRDYPPMVFSLVGFGGHGKTTYLNALLDKIAAIGGGKSRRWRNFSWLPIDEKHLEEVRAKLEQAKRREIPELTHHFSHPLIVQLDSVPDLGNCHLLLCDTAGEVFSRDPEALKASGYFAVKGDVVIWLLSMFDAMQPENYSQNTGGGPQLERDAPLHFLNNYYEAAIAMGKDPKRQSLVVVLTKADRFLSSQDESPARIIPEPAHGNPPQLSRVPRCVRRFVRGMTSEWNLHTLGRVSRSIERWLDKSTQFHNLARRARKQFGKVVYCTVSATGGEPEMASTAPGVERFGMEMAGRGVLAPLRWAGKLQASAMRRARRESVRRRVDSLLQATVSVLLVCPFEIVVGASLGALLWAGLALADTHIPWAGYPDVRFWPSMQALVGAGWGSVVFAIGGITQSIRSRRHMSSTARIARSTVGGLLGGGLLFPVAAILTRLVALALGEPLEGLLTLTARSSLEGASICAMLGSTHGLLAWMSEGRALATWKAWICLLPGAFGASALAEFAPGSLTMAVEWIATAAGIAAFYLLWFARDLVLTSRSPTRGLRTEPENEGD